MTASDSLDLLLLSLEPGGVRFARQDSLEERAPAAAELLTILDCGLVAWKDSTLTESQSQESEEALKKAVEKLSIDSLPVADGEALCYEIDDTAWGILEAIKNDSAKDVPEVTISWLSEAGLVTVTASGRLVLTDSATTWLNAKNR